MTKILFVCSSNVNRSTTAEHIYANRPGLEVKSAGVLPDARTPVTEELLNWADVILVMHKTHLHAIEQKFAAYLDRRTIDCLHVSSVFWYMHPMLIEKITKKVDAWLSKYQSDEVQI